MTPGSQVPTQAEEARFETIHIDDFTPGVYDNSYISLAEPKLSAPLGSADAQFTFCCASLGASLGLGPLPALTTTYTYPNAMPGTSTSAFIIGFAVNPALHDELIIIFAADDGTDHYQQGWSYYVPGANLNQIFSKTTPTHPGIFGAPYPAWTRMNDTGDDPPPELVFPLSDDTTTLNGYLYIYPAIATPTVFSVQNLITSGSDATGQVITYGSRVIVLGATAYPWPIGSPIATNENINFTDPPETPGYASGATPAQTEPTILTAENPWGYGAWGTMSVGELMLIKKYGGGIIMYGDIDNPSSVISMPGVQSTGDFVGKAMSSSSGLIYCAEDEGAWIWNGSNTAQKLSRQLRDNFYAVTTNPAMVGNNYGFCVGTWQNWILFSNNYMYNPDTGGWWVLYPGTGLGNSNVTGHTMWWWIQGGFGHQMYAAPLQFGTSTGLNKNWWYLFDNTVPAPHWQWQSLPIHVVERGDRVIDIRQVILRLSDPSASGNATATVTIGSFTGTATSIPGTPFGYRFNVGVQGVQDFTIKVTGDNSVSGSSPILHSIDLGYEVREGIGVSN